MKRWLVVLVVLAVSIVVGLVLEAAIGAGPTIALALIVLVAVLVDWYRLSKEA